MRLAFDLELLFSICLEVLSKSFHLSFMGIQAVQLLNVCHQVLWGRVWLMYAQLLADVIGPLFAPVRQWKDPL
jgi:hypothetical protein